MIKVEYAELENATQQMRQISQEIDQKLDTLRQKLQKIQWEGADKEAYQQHQAAWDAAIRDINHILGEIGNAVGIAKENYVATEMNNSRLWS